MLWRASLRFLTRHPWPSGLSLLGIALGVAVVVAVDIANASAQRAFERSIEQVAGRATHRIESASGQIPDALHPRLVRELGLRDASPVIEATVRLKDATFTLLGLDLLALGTLRGIDAGIEIEGQALIRLLTDPGTILLGQPDAARLGVAPGDRLTLRIGGREPAVELLGVLGQGSGTGWDGIMIADIATAQELTDRVGAVDRIDLVLSPEEVERVAAHLPAGSRLLPSAQRGTALERMTSAFRINLTAMSLLAMLVGGFIIHNTMTFAVLQRRTLFGSLRTLGCTRAQLFTLILAEALPFALLGGLLGVGLGVLAGWGLVGLVTRTINDLYFTLTVSGLALAPASLIKGVGLGLVVTLVASLGPAIEAARTQPREVLREGSLERLGQRWVIWLALFGAVLAAIGWLSALAPGRSLSFGFLALFLLILGYSLGVPWLLRIIASGLAPWMGRIGGVAARHAARGIAASITRTGIAAAALTVAIATTVGVAVMIDSFRGSLAQWLETTLRSDIYVAAPSGTGSQADGRLPPGIAEALGAIEGIAEMSQARGAQVETEHGPARLLALQSSSISPRGFDFTQGEASDLWPRFEAGEVILVSEPFAYHHRIGLGDRVGLFTPQGWRDFEIGGVFRDYGSGSGMLMMARQSHAALWGDTSISSLGLMVGAGADRREVFERVRAIVESHDRPLLVSLNDEIRERSLAIFDRTFAITEVLRLLAIGVAFVGVLSALMALQLERGREYAILRATGMTRGELTRLVLIQTSLLGLAAGLLAIPLGLIMGDLLIQVINLRSFGWTMRLSLSPAPLISGVLLAWLAAFLAGIYPAIRSANAEPARALRSE
ncbi:hypothetical protein CKO27_07700 [Thiocystis violacea]|nr:hypothetical protein [Thiocystis violacea]